MRKQDILSILFTFTVGFFAGGYLYVVHFAKTFGNDDVPTEADAEQFVIIGEAYGGCRDVCPSFQVLSDGSYRYQFVEAVGADRSIKDGTLPLDLRRELKRVIETKDLVEQSQTITPADCNSYRDGIDVRYRVTLEGAEYRLDSCGTAVDGEGELWGSLSEIWQYFNTI